MPRRARWRARVWPGAATSEPYPGPRKGSTGSGQGTGQRNDEARTTREREAWSQDLARCSPGPCRTGTCSAAAVAGTAPTNVAAGDVPSAASGSVAELEQRVNRLRHQVEARIKQPGAPLKSAPFHTATTIQTVPGDSEVAVVILTSYWYGVQTTDGHTGWIQRRQLEALP